MDYRQLLVDHLELIDRIVKVSARRHRLPAADVDDFASLVRFKLVDSDFAILRKFEGRSQIATYLTVVVERLCIDFCRTRLGKWKPSSSAIRLGPVATLLEQLISREGITFDEAVATLQTNHGVSETREELHDLLMQLPLRRPRVDDVLLERSRAGAGRLLPDEELLARRIEAALAAAIARLPSEDRQILVLRFHVALPVSHIARALGAPPRAMYRRLERILGALRADLHTQGVRPSEIAQVLSHPHFSLEAQLTDV